MRRLPLAVLLVAVVGATIGVYVRNRTPREIEPRIDRTMNQQQAGWGEFFRRRESSLSIDDDGAHFRVAPNGRGLCLGDPADRISSQRREFVTQFTLSKPGEMFWSPDHHGSATFTVKQITRDGVVLSYHSSFCGFSFGDNVILIDEGEITLEPFENRPDQAAE